MVGNAWVSVGGFGIAWVSAGLQGRQVGHARKNAIFESTGSNGFKKQLGFPARRHGVNSAIFLLCSE
jgi:hypothetical protein